jgi:hypothetical protein
LLPTLPPAVTAVTGEVHVDDEPNPSTSRVINDVSGFDGRADPVYPDHGLY